MMSKNNRLERLLFKLRLTWRGVLVLGVLTPQLVARLISQNKRPKRARAYGHGRGPGKQSKQCKICYNKLH